MNVLVVPAGKDASANLRLVWPAATLATHHHRPVKCADPDQWSLDAFLDKHDNVVALKTVPTCDVIVFQRLHDRHMAQAIPFLQASGTAVVIDVDDHFGAVDPNNVAWKTVHPQEVPDKAWRWLDQACANADLVTVTTPALAAHYGKHGRAVVLPNRLPEQILTIRRHPPRRPRHIGWTGDIRTHPRDLQTVGPAVAQILAETGGDRVWNVGPGGIAKPLGVDLEYATGIVEARRWYSTIAALIDIGLAPLADTLFNSNKSGLKLLEYSSLGIPCVASPTPDNQRLHELGMGVLADKPKEWRRELRRLATDDGWWREVGARSKEAARAETLEAHASLWWDAWASAYERRGSLG